MKINSSWLSEYVKFDISLLDKLTNIGIEIDNISNIKIEANDIVTGEVKSCDYNNKQVKVYLNNDYINLYYNKINELDNNDIVAIALPNSSIFKKKNDKHNTYGIICTGEDIGLPNYKHTFKCDLKPNLLLKQYLYLDENIINFLTPYNRPDLLSVYGITREISSINYYYNNLNQLIKYPTIDTHKNIPHSNKFDINIDKHCISLLKLYNIQDNSTSKCTPLDIQLKLIYSGIKLHSYYVDIINYITLLYGIPMHIYDADNINNKSITFQQLYSQSNINNKFHGLNDTEYIIENDDFVAISGDKIISLPGIMGSKDTSISSKTTNYILECGIFDNLKLFKTGTRLNINSNAFIRSSKYIDYHIFNSAIKHLIQLLYQKDDISIYQLYEYIDNHLLNNKNTPIVLSNIQDVLGFTINNSAINEVLKALSYKVEFNNSNFIVTPPVWRKDAINKYDVIEDIIKFVSPTLNYNISYNTKYILSPKKQLLDKILDHLYYNQYHEIMTSPWHLDDKLFLYDKYFDNATLYTHENKPLRSQLLHKLLSQLIKYIKLGKQNIKIFEEGKIYNKEHNKIVETNKLSILIMCDNNKHSLPITIPTMDLIHYIYNNILCTPILIQQNGITIPKYAHPQQTCLLHNKDNNILGYIGSLNPDLIEQIKYKGNIYFAEIDIDKILDIEDQTKNKTPTISSVASALDITIIINKSKDTLKIPSIIEESNTNIQNVKLISIYKKNINDYALTYRVSLYTMCEDKTYTQQLEREIINHLKTML